MVRGHATRLHMNPRDNLARAREKRRLVVWSLHALGHRPLSRFKRRLQPSDSSPYIPARSFGRPLRDQFHDSILPLLQMRSFVKLADPNDRQLYY